MPLSDRLRVLTDRLRALRLLLLLLGGLLPLRALAQPPLIVATAPFDGRELPQPPHKPIEPGFTASVVYETMQAKSEGRPYRLLAPDLWLGMARVKHHGHASDVVGMARLLGARLVMAGSLEATKGSGHPKPYRLHVRIYGAEGGLLGQLSFDLDRPLLQPQSFADKVSAIQLLIEQSLLRTAAPQGSPSPVLLTQPVAAIPPPPVATTLPQRAGQVQQYEDNEKVRFDPEKEKAQLVPLSEAAKELLLRRSPWQAAIDLQVGYVYSTRLLTNEGSELRFGRSGAHGMALLGELHPLALLPSTSPALAGLGLRAQLVLPFWGEIAHVLAPGQPQSGTYTATEYRYDLALRWHLNPWNQLLRPDLAVELLYGEHVFQTAAKKNIDYLRVPPSDYRYVGGALALRMFFTQRWSVTAGATLAKHLSLGLMTRPGSESGDLGAARDRNGFLSYGEGSGWQWRFEGGTQLNLYRGLTVGARVFFEQNRLQFAGEGNVLTTSGQPVTAARDEYLGVMAHLGYVFQPRLHDRPAPKAPSQ